VKNLNDVEVMEYVSEDRVLSIPVIDVGDEAKPMPTIEITLTEKEITFALDYSDAGSLKHLKNLLHESQNAELEAFKEAMAKLPSAFETRLLKKAFKDKSGFKLLIKYASCKVDGQLLQRLISEAEDIRMGGRRIVNDQSIYQVPATPLLQLVYSSLERSEVGFKKVLEAIKPIIKIVSQVKTQREIIHTLINEPVSESKMYSEFVELLNKARSEGLITAVERRAIEKRWRENPADRQIVEEELRMKLGAHIT